MTGLKSAAAAARGRPASAAPAWQAYIKAQVRRRYDYLARTGDFPPDAAARTETHGYRAADLAALPAPVRDAYCGAGDPLAGADLAAVTTLVDLGCGAGADLLLAARRARPGTRLIGVDLAPHMLARLAAAAAAAANNDDDAASPGTCILAVAGDLEALPLRARSADLVIANASLNLCLDADRALAEAWRILRPGGAVRLAEFVRSGPLPIEAAQNPLAWNASIGGIQTPDALAAMIAAAGFTDIAVTDLTRDPRIDVIRSLRISARRPA